LVIVIQYLTESWLNPIQWLWVVEPDTTSLVFWLNQANHQSCPFSSLSHQIQWSLLTLCFFLVSKFYFPAYISCISKFLPSSGSTSSLHIWSYGWHKACSCYSSRWGIQWSSTTSAPKKQEIKSSTTFLSFYESSVSISFL